MSHTQGIPSRRRLLAGGTAALAAGAAIATAAHAGPVASTGAGDDAELIPICRRFAEAHLDGWYRYVVMDGDDDWDTDWDTWERIIATPARTPEGWRAKALAFTAWDRDSYDDAPDDRDGSSSMLASLLRDMVAPERNAIVARLAAKYGPLPDNYTAEGIWLGSASA